MYRCSVERRTCGFGHRDCFGNTVTFLVNACSFPTGPRATVYVVCPYGIGELERELQEGGQPQFSKSNFGIS
jgi:hypothetical protein